MQQRTLQSTVSYLPSTQTHTPTHNTSPVPSQHSKPRAAVLGAAMLVGLLALSGMQGCLAAAAGGVGYAVGHEQGEDHVKDGDHGDDD